MRGMWTRSCWEESQLPRLISRDSANVVKFEQIGGATDGDVLYQAFHAVFTCYAVFLSVAGHFSKLFGHCDKSNVSVSLCCLLISAHGSLEMEKHWVNEIKLWTCLDILQMRFPFSYLCFLKENRRVSETPVSAALCVPGRVDFPTRSDRHVMLLSGTGRQRRRLPVTSSSHLLE